MCGFAGIVAWDDRYHVTRNQLEKMSARIAHRGPDGQGLHLNHEQEATHQRPQVGLVHRRLAILDPDPRSNQPFKDEAGRWLVYNGEIYNYRELRQELKSLRPDYEWRTDGDTEVLLLSYAVWGEHCVDHLNGMFAFAVWDEPKQQLFCAIDRMGQKPLYYAGLDLRGNPWFGVKSPPGRAPADWEEGPIDPPLAVLAIASEPSVFTELDWPARELDWAALHGYLRWGYVPSARSILTGIRRFAPGHSGFLGHRYGAAGWYFQAAVPAVDVSTDPGDVANQTRSRLRRAVERQMVSDVPIGCLLSGGIDSSIVASAMRAAAPQGQPVHTFSLGFDDPRYDESEYAAAVAKHLGTTHHHFVARPSVADDLPLLAHAFGEPFADSSALPTHYLCRETRRHVKVALGGDGGDELFGGYDRYRAMRLAGSLDKVPRVIRQAASAAARLCLPGSHPKSWTTRAKRLLAASASRPASRYADLMTLFSESMVNELVAGHPLEPLLPFADIRHLMQACASLAPACAAMAVDRVTYLPNDLLTKVDRCSMLHALEVRNPFMDHELVQFAAGLTTDQLLGGGPKRMLREAFAADLPAFVFKRKKMGFAVPIGEWFRGELRPMLRDHLFAVDSFASQYFVSKTVERLVDEHESQRVDHSQRLYALLMLELWWKTMKNP